MNADGHEKILKEWRERPLYKNQVFVSDGAIDWECWNKSECRVLFIAKEPNSSEGMNWSLNEMIRCKWKGPYNKLWTVAYWAYGIQKLGHNSIPSNPYYNELWDEVSEALLSTAIVNIKKTEGGSYSDDDKLRKFIDDDRDKDLLKKQIGCLNPNFVVCCKTWHLVKDVWLNTEKVSERVYKIDDMLVLDFWHFANRFPIVMNYYTAMALLQQAISIEALE